jgi:hypothetical protein
MSENDFYVAIQGMMTAAQEAGHPATLVFEWTLNAAEEWLEEVEGDPEDEHE